jgi:anti-sigma regulatory factor (Ser/Thr protein kinase)
MYEPVSAVPGDHGLVHLALFYASGQQYQEDVVPFIHDGLSHSEPVLAAVPGDQVQVLRDVLGGRGHDVAFADMAVLGRNPARIIPAVGTFMDQHPGQRIRCVDEPAWPGRSVEEAREITRHEALVNQAFTGMAATILCPYDSRQLAPSVINEAGGTHPYLLAEGQGQPNRTYLGPVVPPPCESPLPPPPATAETYEYYSDLRQLRQWVTRHASAAGLSPDRIADLVIAASELAANTLRHTPAGGTAHIWHTDDEILCQIHDQGEITDPLAGLRPGAHDGHGHGWWVVNQLCDLTEIRSDPGGTTIRVRMSLKPGRPDGIPSRQSSKTRPPPGLEGPR